MSLNLVSPGVKTREVDLTIGRIDAINDQVGAIAGPFQKGPINVPILIETEDDLLKTFGKPLSADSQYEYWLSASSYLSYGGVLRVIRTDGSNLNNANAAVSGNSTTVKISSYEDYINNQQTATSWYYAAKNPGSWANNLKVCVIDSFADQIISGISTAGLTVGMGVTQSITGRIIPNDTGTTTSADGYIRGIITGVGQSEVYVKLSDAVSGSSVTRVSYSEGSVYSFTNPTTTTTSTTTIVGVATTAGTLSDGYDASITGISTAGIQVNDIVSLTGSTYTLPQNTTVTVLGILPDQINLSHPVTGPAGVGTTVFTFTRSTTTSTTSNVDTIKVYTNAGIETGTINSAATSDWYEQQTLGLTNSTVYWKSIAEKPKTSQYCLERSGRNDEIHIAIVDDTGSVTGIAGNILEKFTYLSKAKDGKISPSESVYYKTLISDNSSYVFAGVSQTGESTGFTKTTTFTKESGVWGQDAQGITFNCIGNKTYNLSGGLDYSANVGMAVSLSSIISSYKILENPAEYSINFLINGPSGGESIYDAQAKAKTLISIAEKRKDCIAVISPFRSGVVNVSDSNTQTDNIVKFFDSITSSSYAVFDSGYKYVNDRFNNTFRYIPCNADIAGLMARTSINQYPWFSPAGSARGSINGAVKLAYNPSQSQRDTLYAKRINPIIFSPGSGIILFGDKTALSYSSAFDRINVRRLFLTLESTIERAARSQLFEFNDIITRSNFLNIVEPYLRDVKSKRGISDFVVICDETNNTPDVIDGNQFRADIFVKPARSINFIGLTFVATRTGVSFEEVVGKV